MMMNHTMEENEALHEQQQQDDGAQQEAEEEHVKLVETVDGWRRQGFSFADIAKFWGISVLKFFRWRQSVHYIDPAAAMNVSDPELDDLVREFAELYPYRGEVMMQGSLFAKGVKVPRARLRASIHRVDPEGVSRRYVE